MVKIRFCGDRTCINNKDGKCRRRSTALNEQGQCLGYSPIMLPQNIGINNDVQIDTEEEVKNPIGFSANNIS